MSSTSSTNPSSPTVRPDLPSTSEPQDYQTGSSDKDVQSNEQHAAGSGDNHPNDQNAAAPRDR